MSQKQHFVISDVRNKKNCCFDWQGEVIPFPHNCLSTSPHASCQSYLCRPNNFHFKIGPFLHQKFIATEHPKSGTFQPHNNSIQASSCTSNISQAPLARESRALPSVLFIYATWNAKIKRRFLVHTSHCYCSRNTAIASTINLTQEHLKCKLKKTSIVM